MSRLLEGRTVVVAGGTGNVGEGVVRAALGEGATVVVPSRSEERLDFLSSSLAPALQEQFIGIVAPYNNFEEADKLASIVDSRVGAITDVTSLIGGWWTGDSLIRLTEADWQKVFVGPATAHLAIARSFIPRLPLAGTYTSITGRAATVPAPNSGPVSMQAAAQLMMRKVLSAENKNGPRINDIILGMIINRARAQGEAQWLTSLEVGNIVNQIIADDAIRNRQLDIQTRDAFNAFIKERL